MKINSLIKNQQLMFLITVVAFGFFSLWVIGDYSSSILLSIVLAFLFRPLLIYLVQIGLPRNISVVITFVISLLAGVGFFLIFIPLFINEAQRYIQAIPNLQAVIEPVNNFFRDLNIPVDSLESVQSVISNFAGFLTNTISFGFSTVQDTANLFVGLLLVPVFLFFWLWDTETLSSGFSKLVPKKRKFLSKVWSETNTYFQDYFKGKFIEVLVVTVFGSLMFYLLGLNSPMLLGVTLGLSQLVPFFGPLFMTIPILIASLAQFGIDPWVLVILFAFAVLQFVDGNIFLPFLMSEVVKLPAIIALLSVFFFGAIFGIWGVFFSIPLASFIKSLLDNWKYIDS